MSSRVMVGHLGWALVGGVTIQQSLILSAPAHYFHFREKLLFNSGV